jgi:hypothetical protein
MALAPDQLEVIARLLRAIAFVILYLLLGFGPGYYLGIFAANRLFGRGNQLRMEKHEDAIEEAIEHNKQWHPDEERWKK